MLVSIVAKFQENRDRDADRYAAWDAALKRLCTDFESLDEVKIEHLRNYLEFIPEQQRFDVLQDLIAAHLRFSWQDKPGFLLDIYLEEYRNEFGQFSEANKLPADLIEDEFLARFQLPYGDCPILAEYKQRFPHCKNLFRTLENRSLDDGRYIKLKILGQGAMSEVWQTYDTLTKKHLALKTVRKNSPHEKAILCHFAAEAANTPQLRQPGIVSLELLTQKSEQASPLYGMPYIAGKTYAQLIAAYHNPENQHDKKASAKRMRHLLEQFREICEALDHAHRQGVLHCDLKPGNILIDKDNKAQIIDWGMSRQVKRNKKSSDVSSSEIAGTPEYMPPEQSRGLTDTRSDIFSLGAILYELLTSSPPRQWLSGAPPADWKKQVYSVPVTPPRRPRDKASKKINAICAKALAHTASDRYQTAREISQELSEHLSNNPATRNNESLMKTIWSKIRRS